MGLQQPPASPGLQRAGLRVLELYSGLGGMRAALERALPMARLQFTAIDINTTANRVYAHNFRDHPLTLSLEHCSAADLARTGTTGPADVWTLSPPCQPFTQTSNSQRRDLADPRAASFAHLMALLPQLPGPLPRYILLEVGGMPPWGASGTMAGAGSRQLCSRQHVFCSMSLCTLGVRAELHVLHRCGRVRQA